MNIEDVTTVEELAEFMEAEAALTGRHDEEQPYVNGRGIRKQWHERINFPFPLFFMVANGNEHNLKSMWFDIDGNRTERPQRNTDTLYHND